MKTLLVSALLCLGLLPGMVLAQGTTITGSVTDEDGEALIGANVLIQSLVLGASTDLEGNYSFTVPADQANGQTVSLRAGYVGYENQTVEITLTSGTQTHDFQLVPDLLNLEEIVVTGVTEATPTKKLAFTVSKLDTEKLQQAPGGSAVESMQGKIAGVSVQQNTGAPGEGLSVRLRGSTSLTGSNEPLYIVDGVILGADQVDFDALDVESMEVVKGAAASSLYGSRAQNGVVQITTRRGSEVPLNQTRITIRNEVGFNSLENTLKANQAHNFATNANGEFLDADGAVVPYGPGMALNDRVNPDVAVSFYDTPYTGTTYDAFDQFFDPGTTMSNYVSIGQNSAKSNFHVSFTNTNEPGVLTGLRGLERQNVTINLDHRLYNNLTLAVTGRYANSTNDTPITAISNDVAFNPFFGIMFTSPLSNLAARDEDGNLFVQADPLSVEENPLYVIENADIFNDRQRLLGSARARFSPLPWLDLEGSFGYDRFDRDQQTFYNRGFDSIDPSSQNDGRIERRNGVSETINADVTASFRYTVSSVTLRSQLKYQAENFESLSETIQGTTLTSAGIKDLSNVNGEKEISNTRQQIRSDGYYATFGADYLDKYIVDFMVRRDGSSLFGADERWHTYYRIAGAYRVSEEAWWPLGAAIPEFKLRYSYGTAGGRPRYEAQYETLELDNGRLTKNTLGNSSLKPELQTEQEFGVDIGLSDRVFIEAVYADSKVEDQLLEIPLAGYFGFESQWQNAGTLESNTIEVSLNADVIRTRNFDLTLGVTFDRTRQEITDFNRPAFRGGPNSAFYFRDGEVLGAMYGFDWVEDVSELTSDLQAFASAFDVNDDGYLVPVGEGNTFQDGFSGCGSGCWGTTVEVGDQAFAWGLPIKRVDDDGNDFFQIGDVLPDFNVGLPINVRYKGFTAGMLWNAQIGGDVYNQTKTWSYRDGRASDQDQSGKPQELMKPTNYYETLYGANSVSSHFVEDGTYVKLRELALGYTFNRVQLQRVFGNVLNRVSVDVIGRNLITFTDYSGFDPEVGNAAEVAGVGGDATLYRVDNFTYPPFRTITAKLEIQF